MPYRTGNHWGVTIVREATPPPGPDHWHEGPPCDECPRDAELVAVIVNGDQALAKRICELLNGEPAEPAAADSCTCVGHITDLHCVVHQGRKARGPKPPPLGPGCICDGSGRACPRHGVVL